MSLAAAPVKGVELPMSTAAAGCFGVTLHAWIAQLPVLHLLARPVMAMRAEVPKPF